MHLNKAIVFGKHVNALSIIRSLGEMQIDSICIHPQKGIASWSKYQKFYKCPDPIDEPQKCLERIIKIGKGLNEKGVVYATDDEWLYFLNQNREELSKYFLFTMSDYSVMENAIFKDKMYQKATDAGLPLSKMVFSKGGIPENIREQTGINYPFVVKPCSTIKFKQKINIRGRTILINNDKDFQSIIKVFQSDSLLNVPLIIQNHIPGPDENLYTVTAYSNKKAQIVDYVIGYKIRQDPPQAGTITSGRLKHVDVLLEYSRDLIKELNFWGISNTEFKYDDEDHTYKLIEINCRPGMMNRIATFAGKNLPYYAYCESIGEEIPLQEVHTDYDGAVWLYLRGDLVNYFIKGNRKTKNPSIKNWFNSVQGKKYLAVESIIDPMPMIADWIFDLRYITGIFKI